MAWPLVILEGPVLIENSSRLERSFGSASCSRPRKGSRLVYTSGPLCLQGVPRCRRPGTIYSDGHCRSRQKRRDKRGESAVLSPGAPAAPLLPHMAGTRVASEHPQEAWGAGRAGVSCTHAAPSEELWGRAGCAKTSSFVYLWKFQGFYDHSKEDKGDE